MKYRSGISFSLFLCMGVSILRYGDHARSLRRVVEIGRNKEEKRERKGEKWERTRRHGTILSRVPLAGWLLPLKPSSRLREIPKDNSGLRSPKVLISPSSTFSSPFPPVSCSCRLHANAAAGEQTATRLLRAQVFARE